MVVALALGIFILDQLSKYAVERWMHLFQSIPVIPGIFHFTLIYNRGAAFGILKNQTPVFIVTSLAAIALIAANLRQQPRTFSLEKLSLWLILAGALGNLIDRLRLGYVIDFLDLRIWPVFNIADSAISVGAVLLGVTLLRQHLSRTRLIKDLRS